jgi:hypothetical protein
MGVMADMAKRAQTQQASALVDAAVNCICRAKAIIPDLPRVDLQQVSEGTCDDVAALLRYAARNLRNASGLRKCVDWPHGVVHLQVKALRGGVVMDVIFDNIGG